MDRSAWEPFLKADALFHGFAGLGNRHALDKQLEVLLADESRGDAHVAVFLLDLDRFIFINDQYGHDVGDDILLTIARRLRALDHSTGWAYYLAGDEFVVVLAGISGRAGAVTLAERIVDTIRAPLTAAELPDGSRTPEGTSVSASVGIAIMTPRSTPQGLLLRADIAMYAAKMSADQGQTERGNRALLFDDLPFEQRRRAQELEAE